MRCCFRDNIYYLWLLVVSNLRVEMLIQLGRCLLSTPSMHKLKLCLKHIYEVCMYMAKQSHLLFAVVIRWTSSL